MGREHRLHQPVLQMCHPHKHHPRHLQHHINHNPLQTHNTPHQARTNNISKHLRKQILTSLLSLQLQEKISSVYQNLQMVLGRNAVSNSQDSQMSAFAFTAICLVILRETVPKFPIVLNVGQKDTHRTDVPTSHRGPDIHTQLANPETSRKGRTISHSFQAITISVCSVQEIIRPPTVCDNNSHHLLILLLVVQVFPLTKMHLVLHAHLFILIRNHQPHIVNLHCMYKHPLST